MVPNRWLFKTEPTAYSFHRLERERRSVWDGVENALARKHLGAVRKGDAILVYHTGDERAVVGVARALCSAYPDPKLADPKAPVVDIAPVKRLPRPVPLSELKARASLAAFPLVRLPRLSVMPVTAAEWAEIERLAKR